MSYQSVRQGKINCVSHETGIWPLNSRGPENQGQGKACLSTQVRSRTSCRPKPPEQKITWPCTTVWQSHVPRHKRRPLHVPGGNYALEWLMSDVREVQSGVDGGRYKLSSGICDRLSTLLPSSTPLDPAATPLDVAALIVNELMPSGSL